MEGKHKTSAEHYDGNHKVSMSHSRKK